MDLTNTAVVKDAQNAPGMGHRQWGLKGEQCSKWRCAAAMLWQRGGENKTTDQPTCMLAEVGGAETMLKSSVGGGRYPCSGADQPLRCKMWKGGSWKGSWEAGGAHAANHSICVWAPNPGLPLLLWVVWAARRWRHPCNAKGCSQGRAPLPLRVTATPAALLPAGVSRGAARGGGRRCQPSCCLTGVGGGGSERLPHRLLLAIRVRV